MRNYRAAAQGFLREAGDPRRAGAGEVARWRRRIEQVRRGGVLAPAAASTSNVKLVAVRALFQFLLSRGLRADDPTAGLKLRREPARLPKPIPEADVPKILTAAREEGPQARAVVETFLGGGLRGSEVALLRLGQVVDREFLRVVGKGNKEGLVPMTDPQYEALRDWALEARGDEEAAEVGARFGADAAFLDLCQRHPERAFFLNPAGTALPELRQPRNVVYKLWKKVCRRAGVPEYNPHRARHTVATGLIENGAPLPLVQEMLRHQDIRTTMAYTKVTKRGLRTLRGFHSRSRMEV